MVLFGATGGGPLGIGDLRSRLFWLLPGVGLTILPPPPGVPRLLLLPLPPPLPAAGESVNNKKSQIISRIISAPCQQISSLIGKLNYNLFS